jgi:tetratricopeptide (TPR) repeat protein
MAALRKAAVEAVATQVKALIQSDDAFQGELVLLEGLRRFPDSDELTVLRPNVDAARRSEWERKSRQASRVRALTNIQQLLTDHKLAAAADAIRLFELEQGAGAESLKAAIDQQLQEIARVRAEVAERSKVGGFPAAVEILERALRRFPGDGGLRDDWTRLQAARAQQERQEAYARGRAEFNSLVRHARHDEAIAEIQRLIALFPEDPALPQDLESARSAKRLASRRVADPTGIRLRPDPPPVARAAARLTRVAERTTAALARAREIRTRVSATTRTVSGKSLARADEVLKGIGRWRWPAAAGVAVALGAIVYGVWSPSQSKATGLNLQPSELEFSFRQGDPEPSPQSIHVSTSDSRALWRITSSASWLGASPGAVSQSGSFAVQVSPAGLAPSDYSASLSLEGDQRVTPAQVRVRLHVLPAVAAAPRRSGPSNSAPERKARPDREDRDSSAQPLDRVNTEEPKPLPVATPAAVSETAREGVTDCHQLGYQGLSAGELFWMGTLEPNQAVTIGRENTVLAGPVASVKGSPLPGCEVSVSPARSGITVTETPAQANRFSRVTMKNTSSHPIMNPRLLWTIK